MEKKHISLWLDEELLKECDEMIKDGSAKNRSEYFETALKFYNDYQKGKEYGEIFGQTLMKVFQGTMNSFGNRMASPGRSNSFQIPRSAIISPI